MVASLPNLKRRKADVGDNVTFVVDRYGNSAYFAHLDHHGIIQDVVLTYENHRSAPRATYTIECECGLTLHPRSTAFERAI
jgi:hypothetical protein